MQVREQTRKKESLSLSTPLISQNTTPFAVALISFFTRSTENRLASWRTYEWYTSIAQQHKIGATLALDAYQALTHIAWWTSWVE